VLNKSNIEDPIRIDKIKAKGASGLYLVDDNDSGIFIDSNEIRMGYRDPTFTDIDFTSPAWTEEDPGTDIVVTAPKVAWTALPRNLDSYVYYDFTAAYFDGDFRHEFEISATHVDDGAIVVFWMLSNDIDDISGLMGANKSLLGAFIDYGASNWYITLVERDGAASYQQNSANFSYDTPYYITIVRDESVGTYGTFYCYIYSDMARTVLVDKQELTLHTSKKDFQYLFSCNTYNDTGAQTGTGYTQNLRLSTDPFGIEKGIFVHDDGTVDMEMQSGCSITRSGNQTIGTGDWAVVQFNNEFWDVHNEFNVATYKYTAIRPGWRKVAMAGYLTLTVAGKYFEIGIRKNGGTWVKNSVQVYSAPGYCIPCTTGVVWLDAGDYLEGLVFHDDGDDRALQGNPQYTYLDIQKIA